MRLSLNRLLYAEELIWIPYFKFSDRLLLVKVLFFTLDPRYIPELFKLTLLLDIRFDSESPMIIQLSTLSDEYEQCSPSRTKLRNSHLCYNR